MVPPKDRMSTTARIRRDGDPPLRRLVGRARHAAHPGREQRGRRAAGQGRPPELEEAEHGVEARPEPSARAQAHDAAVDGLAGVERVADALQVEEHLQHDGHGGDEEDVGAVLDRGRRPHQPLAAADRSGGHDRARADDLHGIAHAEGQRGGQLGDVPGGQCAVVGRKGGVVLRPADAAWRRKRSWRGVYSHGRVRSILPPIEVRAMKQGPDFRGGGERGAGGGGQRAVTDAGRLRPRHRGRPHRGRHRRALVPRRRRDQGRPHHRRRRPLPGHGGAPHRRARPHGGAGVHRHARTVRDDPPRRQPRGVEDPPGHHVGDHGRGRLRGPGQRSDAEGPAGLARQVRDQGGLDGLPRLLRRPAPRPARHQSRIVRGRGPGAPGRARLRGGAAHAGAAAPHGGAGRGRDGAGRAGPLHLAHLSARRLRAHAGADRARSRGRAPRRRLRLAHPRRGQPPDGRPRGGHHHRTRGRRSRSRSGTSRWPGARTGAA